MHSAYNFFVFYAEQKIVLTWPKGWEENSLTDLV